MVPTHSLHQRAPKSISGYSDFTQGPTQFHGGAGLPSAPGVPVSNGMNFNVNVQPQLGGRGISYPVPGNYNQNYSNAGQSSGWAQGPPQGNQGYGNNKPRDNRGGASRRW